MRRLAATSFDLEPTGRAALVDLLFHRPPGDPSLRLIATVDGSPVAFAFGSVHERTGYLDGLAVDEAVRRRGVGTALLNAIEDRLTRAGAEHFAIGGNSWFYAWPGIDLGYTAALCFAERHGYRRVSVVQNMDVSLDRWVPGRADEVLDRHGRKATVRRAEPADWPARDLRSGPSSPRSGATRPGWPCTATPPPSSSRAATSASPDSPATASTDRTGSARSPSTPRAVAKDWARPCCCCAWTTWPLRASPSPRSAGSDPWASTQRPSTPAAAASSQFSRRARHPCQRAPGDRLTPGHRPASHQDGTHGRLV